MIVILFTALVFTHILKYGTNVSEGMENEDDSVMDNSGNVISTKKNKQSEESESSTSEPMTQKEKKTKVTANDLKDDLTDFQSIQDKILSGMREIDPLLTKAEAFIEKFEQYKASKKIGGADDDE
jgi:hypothetical protein